MKNISKKALKGVSFLALIILLLASRNAFAMLSQPVMTDAQAGDVLAQAWDNYGTDSAGLRHFNIGSMTDEEAAEKIYDAWNDYKVASSNNDAQAVDAHSKSRITKPNNKNKTHYDLGLKSLQAWYEKRSKDSQYQIKANMKAWSRYGNYLGLHYRGEMVGFLSFRDVVTGNTTRRVITGFNLSNWPLAHKELHYESKIIFIKKFIEEARSQGVREVSISPDNLSMVEITQDMSSKIGFTYTETLVAGSQSMSMRLEPLEPAAESINADYQQHYDFMHEGNHIGRATYADTRVDSGVRRHISRLDVYDGYRDQGHGTRHMKAFIEKARREGVTEITLYALSRPVPFYRKLGFKGAKQESYMMHLEPPKSKDVALTRQDMIVNAFEKLVIPIESAQENEALKKLFCVDDIKPHVGLAGVLDPVIRSDKIAENHRKITYDPADMPLQKTAHHDQSLDLARKQYCAEYAQLKQNPSYKYVFDENADWAVHNTARRLENAKSMNLANRGMNDLLVNSVQGIILSSTNMPTLYAYVDNLCKTHKMSLPVVVIARNEGFFGNMAQKLFTLPSTIVIGESLLKTLPDCELEAIIAHEMAHIRYGHTWKRLLANIGSAVVFSLARSYCYGNGDGGAELLLASLYLPKLLGKPFEREADSFVCDQANNAHGLMSAIKRLQKKAYKKDTDLNNLYTAITESKSQVGTLDYILLLSDCYGAKMIHQLGKWYTSFVYSSWFGEQYSPQERISNAKHYL